MELDLVYVEKVKPNFNPSYYVDIMSFAWVLNPGLTVQSQV